ncbi:MAG: ankyrin repeat domain-containing protein [Syntrophaceae bacterium]
MTSRMLLITACVLSVVLLQGCATPNEQMYAAIKTNDASLANKALGEGAKADGYILYAVRQRKHDIVKLLLAKGADTNITEKSFDIDGGWSSTENSKGKWPRYTYRVKRVPGANALIYAIENNDAEMVKILLEAGAKPNVECALMSASIYHYEDKLSDDGCFMRNSAFCGGGGMLNIFEKSVTGESWYAVNKTQPVPGGVNRAFEAGELNLLTPQQIDRLLAAPNTIMVRDGIIYSPSIPLPALKTTPIKLAEQHNRKKIVELLRASTHPEQ